ncbi:NUDIX hydrolase [Phaeacidiphilus oryzae]|uniref:NUDIX hydrolase n=1 Tax=Phaeacidiphilus oryzae TaxID=348818 RepID=UPI00056887E2|nr:NUDIX hydrolase [Phaeacidiphilus oryzae]
MPPSWPQRIRALLDGRLTPVRPRPAATVVLLRDRPGGPQVYLLRRRRSMAFAAGMYAYPGGSVDVRDGEQDLHRHWAGPDAEAWGERLGCPPAEAQALVCAAVRETFEESGVLLAGAGEDSVLADVSGPSWRADRAALEAHQLSFAEFLDRRGLVLRSDLLAAWARWITPEFEERRFDTWFFTAVVPAGQRTAEVPGEADRVVWLRPEEALAEYRRGAYALMPPQLSTLGELRGYADAAEVTAAAGRRELLPVLGRASLDEEGRISIRWPGHAELTMNEGA